MRQSRIENRMCQKVSKNCSVHELQLRNSVTNGHSSH